MCFAALHCEHGGEAMNMSWLIRIAIGLVPLAVTVTHPSDADARRGFLSSFTGRAAGAAVGSAVGSGKGSATTGSATASKELRHRCADTLAARSLRAAGQEARRRRRQAQRGGRGR